MTDCAHEATSDEEGFDTAVTRSCTVVEATSVHYTFRLDGDCWQALGPAKPCSTSEPSIYPGAGIYISPLSFTSRRPPAELWRIIHDVFAAMNMPYVEDYARFKIKVAAYFTSGFARFYVRIWCRQPTADDDAPYIVDIMRERVSFLFQHLLLCYTGVGVSRLYRRVQLPRRFVFAGRPCFGYKDV
jgi:hypothetical protein